MESCIDRGRGARGSKYVWLAESGIVSILCVWITLARGKSCCNMSLWKIARTRGIGLRKDVSQP